MPVTPTALREVAACLRALGNERRLRIVSHLARGPMVVTDLSDVLRCSVKATSKHLQRLHACGMVDREQRGVSASYSLHRNHPFIRIILPMLR